MLSNTLESHVSDLPTRRSVTTPLSLRANTRMSGDIRYGCWRASCCWRPAGWSTWRCPSCTSALWTACRTPPTCSTRRRGTPTTASRRDTWWRGRCSAVARCYTGYVSVRTRWRVPDCRLSCPRCSSFRAQNSSRPTSRVYSRVNAGSCRSGARQLGGAARVHLLGPVLPLGALVPDLLLPQRCRLHA